MILFGLLTTFFISENVWARSLKASADKLSQEASTIGIALSIFGLALGGIYFVLGRQDASTKLTQALMGILVLLLAPSIVSFIKGLV